MNHEKRKKANAQTLTVVSKNLKLLYHTEGVC